MMNFYGESKIVFGDRGNLRRCRKSHILKNWGHVLEIILIFRIQKPLRIPIINDISIPTQLEERTTSKELLMLKMEGPRVRMIPENIHNMLKQGLSFREIAARCEVFEDAIDASLMRWLNQGRWPIEDHVVAA